MLLIGTSKRDFDGKSVSQDAGVDQGKLGWEDNGHTALVSRAFTVAPAGAGTDGGKGEGTAPVGDVKFRPMGFLQEANSLRRQVPLDDRFGVKVCGCVRVLEVTNVPREETRRGVPL